MNVIEGDFGKKEPEGPDEELIKTLETMLQKAKEGIITDMSAVTFENKDGDMNSYWHCSGFHGVVMATMLQTVAIERIRRPA